MLQKLKYTEKLIYRQIQNCILRQEKITDCPNICDMCPRCECSSYNDPGQQKVRCENSERDSVISFCLL